VSGSPRLQNLSLANLVFLGLVGAAKSSQTTPRVSNGRERAPTPQFKITWFLPRLYHDLAGCCSIASFADHEAYRPRRGPMEGVLAYIVSGEPTMLSGPARGISGTLLQRAQRVQHAQRLAWHMLDSGFLNVSIKNSDGKSIEGEDLLDCFAGKKQLSEELGERATSG
jgi:hypothetical protein